MEALDANIVVVVTSVDHSQQMKEVIKRWEGLEACPSSTRRGCLSSVSGGQRKTASQITITTSSYVTNILCFFVEMSKIMATYEMLVTCVPWTAKITMAKIGSSGWFITDVGYSGRADK